MCPKHVKKTHCFFDFSNHARAQVPIFTPKMKKMELARPARLSTRKWDFRRRSRPRELAHRSQDDVSLNKLPQIKIGRGHTHPQKARGRTNIPKEFQVWRALSEGIRYFKEALQCASVEKL